MAYFPDLSPYTYMHREEPNVFNVGWLDRDHPFPTGTIQPEVFGTLLRFCRKPDRVFLGFHTCPWCGSSDWGLQLRHDEHKLLLGRGDIRVPGADGRVYAAPDLIFHYVRDHDYLPPEEFLDALRELPEGFWQTYVPGWKRS